MKSKVDRIRELFESSVRRAVESCRLDAHTQGNHGDANVLRQYEDRIRIRAASMGTYERLELDDIIKGHKRAWPE